MKHAEEAIENVLAGLRNCHVPPEMERRILCALEDHASARSRSRWRRLMPLWLGVQPPAAVTRPIARGVALAAIFTLFLAVLAIHRLGHAPTPSKKDSAPLSSLPAAAPSAVAANAPLPASVPIVRRKGRSKANRAELVPASDSLALREMHASSRPEPPMPLTEQEKLLVRFVHARSREELAMLDPVKWAARDAQERAELDRFFGQ